MGRQASVDNRWRGRRGVPHRRLALFCDFRSDIKFDTSANTVGRWTPCRVNLDGSLGTFAGAGRDTQGIAHADSRNAQHLVDSFDIAFHRSANLV